MKKFAFVLSFMLLGFVGFSNLNNLDSENATIPSKVYVKTETKTIDDRCFVRYCVETDDGLSCTEWKEIPCGGEQ